MSEQPASEAAGQAPLALERELISRRELARRKHWAPSYAVKLCQQGVLSVFVPCPGCGVTVETRQESCQCGQAIAGQVDAGRGKVDARIVEHELARHRDPGKEYTRDRWSEHRGESPPASDAPGGADQSVSPSVSDFASAKAKRESFQARLAELDYYEKAGELVSRETVRREGFKVGRMIRDKLLNVPDRLAPVLAAERDEARVHQLLVDEIRNVLDELSGGGGNTGSASAA